MKDFTDLEAIKKIDPQDTLGSTEKLIEQCEAAWQQVKELHVAVQYDNIDTIICCGMGASVYGALVFKALLGSDMQYPLEIISDYHLPHYVNEKTLVILTSYSGTTEEVLSCAEEALKKNAKMIVLARGGPLGEFAKTHAIPAYIFDEALNPSRVPRLGAGYTILGLLGLLQKVGILMLDEGEITSALTNVKTRSTDIKTRAMGDAQALVGKIPIIFSAEHLAGNAQIFRNQFNETSKAFSSFFLIPDLNHHLMEGLQFPTDAKLVFIVLDSPNYSPKIAKRVELTIDVVKQNKREVMTYKSGGVSIYEDFLEVMLYGCYTTLYLGLLHDQNPAINPWVDWFKEKLK